MSKDRYRGIKRLGRGRYRIRARALDPATGRPAERDRIVECSGVTEAARMRDELAEEIRAGIERPTRRRLGDYASDWLEARTVRLRASSTARYIDAVGHIDVELGAVYLDTLRPGDVEKWLAKMARRELWSNATINGWFRVLKVITRSAARDLGISDPCAGVRPLQEEPSEREGLEAAELGALISHVRDHEPEHYPLLAVLAYTGMRWGEATAMRWEDVDEAGERLLVRRAHYRGTVGPTKNGRPRAYPLVPELLEALRSHRRRLVAEQGPGLAEGWCFAVTARDGSPALPAPSSWAKALPRWLSAAGVRRRITPHGLRRTWVDLSRLAKVDPTTRRALVGHAGEAVHDRYSTVRQAEAAGAVGAIVALVGAQSGGSSGGGE